MWHFQHRIDWEMHHSTHYPSVQRNLSLFFGTTFIFSGPGYKTNIPPSAEVEGRAGLLDIFEVYGFYSSVSSISVIPDSGQLL